MIKVIAEIGCNFSFLSDAVKMIHEAADTKADFVKFQMFNEETIKDSPLFEKLKPLILKEESIKILHDEAVRVKIGFILTPMYLEAVDIAAKYADIIKIRFKDHGNTLLIDKAQDTGKLVLISVPIQPINSFSLRTKYMYCFPPNTQVYTFNGTKKIVDIHEGEYVLSHTGHWRKVISTMSRYVEELLLRLKVEGVLPFSCTKNHPFLIGRLPKGTGHDKEHYGSFESEGWVKANSLKSGNLYKGNERPDFVFVRGPLGGEGLHSLPIPRVSKHGNLTDIPVYVEVNTEIMAILGAFVAEGAITTSRQSITGINFSFRKDEPLSKVVQSSMNKLFPNIKPSIFEKDNVVRQTYCSVHLGHWLAHDCYSSPVNSSGNKKAPSFLFDVPLKYRKDFIEYAWMGDGSGPDYATVSPSLAWDMFFLCHSVGIPVAITRRRCEGRWGYIQGRKVWEQPTYVIRKKSTENPFYRTGNDGYYYPLRKIEHEYYAGWVCNLEVEYDNSYFANGVAVHNCIPKYPPEPEDFCLDFAAACGGGFSSHYPHTLFDLAYAINRLYEDTYIEKHVMINSGPERHLKIDGQYLHSDERYHPIDENVSITFSQLQKLISELKLLEQIRRIRI